MANDMNSSPDPARQSIWPETLAFVALWTFWFAWFYRLWPLWDDHAVYHLMAANWLGGGKPYVDAIDPNWPGTMLLHAIAFALSGYEVWGFRLLDAGLQIGLATVTFYLLAAWRVDRLWRVLAVTLFSLCYLQGTYGNTGQRECLALPFLVVGLLPWLLPLERAQKLSWVRLIFVHGACLGAAVCIKPPLGLVMVIVGAGALALQSTQWREWLRWVVSGAVGGFLFLGVVAALLAWSGSLAAFWQWGVAFAFTEYVQETVPWPERFVDLAKWMRLLGGLISVVWAAGVIVWLRRGHGLQSPIALLGILAAGFLAGALVQGKTFCPYHFMPWFYGLSLVTAVWWSQSRVKFTSRQRQLVYAALVILIGGMTVIFSGYSNAPTSGYALGKQLQRELRSGEQVLVVGFAPTMYVALEQSAPYPWLNSMLFYVFTPQRQEVEEERLLAILADERTRYFLIDSIHFRTKRPWTRVDRRSRIATFLQEHFSEPKIREVRGNPLEFAEPVQYLIYERQAGSN